MTRKNPKDMAASVRQRLLNLSRQSGEDFQRLLTRYAMERLLDRLSRSEHAPRFVLKGALLFALWTGELHRPTRDLDLLGFGESSRRASPRPSDRSARWRSADDGLVFTADTVAVEPIREDQEYGGQRVKLEARLGQARIDLQVDVGFGDAITPRAEAVAYPTLLGMESAAAPRLPAGDGGGGEAGGDGEAGDGQQPDEGLLRPGRSGPVLRVLGLGAAGCDRRDVPAAGDGDPDGAAGRPGRCVRERRGEVDAVEGVREPQWPGGAGRGVRAGGRRAGRVPRTADDRGGEGRGVRVAVGTERSVAAGVMRGGARSIRKLKGEVQMEKWSCVTGFGSHNAVENRSDR